MLYDLLYSVLGKVVVFLGVIGAIPAFLIFAKWGFYLALGFTLFVIRASFAVYHGFRIFVDMSILTFLKLYVVAMRMIIGYIKQTPELRLGAQAMQNATNYEEYLKHLTDSEHKRRLMDKHASVYASLGTLQATTKRLQEARHAGEFKDIIYEIPMIVKRNYLGIDDILLHDRHATEETLQAIEEFNQEINACIDSVCDADSEVISTEEKIMLLKKLSRNIGHSALCLSGGGAITMYHVGVIKCLIDHGLYKHIHVISGASGGSISAAMCAMATEETMLRDFTNENVSTNYRGDGSMKLNNIRWFPPLFSQAIHFIKTGYLVDNEEFSRTCHYYYGDITFEEAYKMTKKHVCIAVTASNGGGSGITEKLLLNHLSTPHVLLRSAVAASCALPGIMKPNKLLCKLKNGEIIPFESDGSHWVDGSIGNDVPFKRMSALFSVSNFIVSQVNFHVVPFIVRGNSSSGGITTGSKQNDNVMSMIMSSIECDLAFRTEQLNKMKLLPRLYGQQINSVFKQQYHGHITIIPELRWDETFGVKAIMNPSMEDMRNYLSGGQRATWRVLRETKHLLSIERCIWSALERLVVLSDPTDGNQASMPSPTSILARNGGRPPKPGDSSRNSSPLRVATGSKNNGANSSGKSNVMMPKRTSSGTLYQSVSDFLMFSNDDEHSDSRSNSLRADGLEFPAGVPRAGNSPELGLWLSRANSLTPNGAAAHDSKANTYVSSYTGNSVASITGGSSNSTVGGVDINILLHRIKNLEEQNLVLQEQLRKTSVVKAPAV